MTANPYTAARMREIREGILGVTRTEITYRPGAERIPVPVATSPVVIVVGGGLMQWESFVQARLLGFRVVMTDRDPECFMARHADEFAEIDVFNGEAHVQLVNSLRQRGYTVAGIFVGGIDAEMTAAYVAEKCGLPGNTVLAAMNCRDKGLMRAAFDAYGHDSTSYGDETDGAGVRIEWQYAAVLDEIGPYMWMALGRRGRLIVKPLRQSASRGITIVERPDQVQAALDAAIAAGNGYDRLALVEECVETSFLYSVEIARINGEWVDLNVVDRLFDPRLPLIEWGHINPTRESAEVRASLFALARRAAEAVEVTHGVFKIDAAMDTWGNLYVLECTARLSGGFDSQITSPLTGRNFVAVGLALATGRDVDPGWIKPHEGYAICLAAFPPSGTIRHAPGWRSQSPYLEFYYQSKYGVWRGANVGRYKAGDVIPPYRDCGSRPAFVIRHAFALPDRLREIWNETVDDANEMAEWFQIDNPTDEARPELLKDFL